MGTDSSDLRRSAGRAAEAAPSQLCSLLVYEKARNHIVTSTGQEIRTT